MMKTNLKFLCAAALMVCVCTSSASAGIILSGSADPLSPGLGTVAFPLLLSLSPNNDNSSDLNSGNNIEIITKAFEFNDYIDIVFVVQATSGTTEYRVSESVDNDTGVDWLGYNMRLGFGTGAGFTDSTPLDGLDFDWQDFDPAPTSTAFANVVMAEDMLSFSNGLHSTAQQNYNFRIDVPDLVPGQNYTFTLRQTPLAVPEPTALALVALAIAGFLGRRRVR